jgi:hypothetical protein
MRMMTPLKLGLLCLSAAIVVGFHLWMTQDVVVFSEVSPDRNMIA